MKLAEESLLFLCRWLFELAGDLDKLRLPGQAGFDIHRVAMDSRLLHAWILAGIRAKKTKRGGRR
jgi:hypothetical protein